MYNSSVNVDQNIDSYPDPAGRAICSVYTAQFGPGCFMQHGRHVVTGDQTENTRMCLTANVCKTGENKQAKRVSSY